MKAYNTLKNQIIVDLLRKLCADADIDSHIVVIVVRKLTAGRLNIITKYVVGV